jgi:Xaa-Pro dipeptidase
MGPREEALWNAQRLAQSLFDRIVELRLIRAGALESQLNDDIHQLAKAEFGVKRHWHKRIVRSGANTLTGYHDSPPDRLIVEDDVVYLDFGPVFDRWEADFGRTFVLGDDPRKHQLVSDIGEAFELGKQLFESKQDLTAGELFDYVHGLATQRGWTFGAVTAGHLVDRFPHESNVGGRFTIRKGNGTSLREPQEDGSPRHWILEIHFVDLARQYGGFLEELLTIRG